MKAYDLEKIYNEQISPLMTQILEICKQNELPMAVSFQYKGDGEEEFEFCNSAVLPEERPISEELEKIWNILNERRAKPLTLKVVDPENKTIEITEIHT
jgi:hypothetical protein